MQPRSYGILLLCVICGPAIPAQSAGAPNQGGTIVGEVIFRGTVPPPQTRTVSRNSDFCGKTVSVQPLLVDAASRGVQDAVVSVEAQPGGTEAAPTPILLSARKCAFEPKVVAAQVGQSVMVGNDDPVMHNVNVTLRGRTVMNEALVADGSAVEKTLARPGPHSLVCNAHKFMTGHLLTFEHPYFAVSSATGRFRIAGLPPG